MRAEKEKPPAATGGSGNIQQPSNPSIVDAQKLSNIPDTAPTGLRALPCWLIWRYEQHDGEPKPRKVPYYSRGSRRGKHGTPEDRNQLTTFDAARIAAISRGFTGVGFAPLPEFGIVALDFDNCVADGGVHPDVERLVACTYAEYSPSGNGVRAFMRGDLGNHKSGGEPFGFEVFSTKLFVTFTGNRLDITDLLGTENTIADVTADVRALAAARFGNKTTEAANDDPLMTFEPRLELTAAQLYACLAVLDPDMEHDAWLHVGMALHHETEGEGFALWDAWSAKGSKYPGGENLQRRWDSFGRPGGRPVTARYLVKLANENGAGIDLDLGSANDFEEAAAASVEDLRFRVVPAGEFAHGKLPGWIIKGVIPQAEVVMLYGESGSGKSFLMLDIGAAIARGIEWRGNRTKAGRVVYIAAEGADGFRKRLRAYEAHNKVSLNELPFGVIHAAPNFLQKADALEVAKAIKATGGADVVIVDTLAQVTPGANENGGEDMGVALTHCRGIHRATGATVILVHHSGKDPTRGARGWSGIRAAVDAEIEVLRTIAGRMVRISKQKDGSDGREWGFALHVVPVGIDDDGDVIDSCVVIDAELPMLGRVGSRRRPLGKWEQLIMEVVSEFAIGQSSGIEVDQVLAEALRRAPPVEEGKRDTRKQHARRALVALCEGDEAPYFLEDDCLTVLE